MIKKIDKIILLVGLMGSGKTSVGKRLAKKLNLPFVDGDQEIEKAAGLSLVDVLKCFGEEEYRAGEKRVMKRLLQGAPCVLASGGGSFVAEQTRELAKIHAITVWLKADVDVLYNRTAGRKHRPFLEGDDSHLKNKLEKYISEEYPYYSEADIVVETREEQVDNTVLRVIDAIDNFLSSKKPLKQRFFCVWRNILCRFGFPIGLYKISPETSKKTMITLNLSAKEMKSYHPCLPASAVFLPK